MNPCERRKHRRLDIRLPLEYRVTDRENSPTYRTITRNLSTGGLYFEIEGPSLLEGQTLNLELTVPPGTHFPYQGRVSGVAEITRVVHLPAVQHQADRGLRFGIGAKLENWVLSF